MGSVCAASQQDINRILLKMSITISFIQVWAKGMMFLQSDIGDCMAQLCPTLRDNKHSMVQL